MFGRRAQSVDSCSYINSDLVFRRSVWAVVLTTQALEGLWSRPRGSCAGREGGEPWGEGPVPLSGSCPVGTQPPKALEARVRKQVCWPLRRPVCLPQRPVMQRQGVWEKPLRLGGGLPSAPGLLLLWYVFETWPVSR